MTDRATNAGSIYQSYFLSLHDALPICDYIALSVGTVTQTTAHFAPWIRLVSPTGALLGNSSTQTGASNIAATARSEERRVGKDGSYGGGPYDGTESNRLKRAKGAGAGAVSTGDAGCPRRNA